MLPVRKCICICESQVAHGLQMLLTLDRRRTDSYKSAQCEWERESQDKPSQAKLN